MVGRSRTPAGSPRCRAVGAVREDGAVSNGAEVFALVLAGFGALFGLMGTNAQAAIAKQGN